MTTPIELFFDFLSPYGCVASERIDKLAGNGPQHIGADIQFEDLKHQLCAINDQALPHGGFALPLLVVDQEPFWGPDPARHFDQQLSRSSW